MLPKIRLYLIDFFLVFLSIVEKFGTVAKARELKLNALLKGLIVSMLNFLILKLLEKEVRTVVYVENFLFPPSIIPNYAYVQPFSGHNPVCSARLLPGYVQLLFSKNKSFCHLRLQNIENLYC